MFFQIMIHLIPSSCLKQMQWNALRPSMVCTVYKGTLDCALTWQTAKYQQAFHFLPFFPLGRGRESVKKREELMCWYKIYLLTLKKEEITVMMCIYTKWVTHNTVAHRAQNDAQPDLKHWMPFSQPTQFYSSTWCHVGWSNPLACPGQLRWFCPFLAPCAPHCSH